MIFRGCERGLSGTPKAKTHEAPNRAIINGIAVSFVNNEIDAIARNPPIPENNEKWKLTFKGLFSLLMNFNKYFFIFVK